MSDVDKVKALELANQLGGTPEEVVARATKYQAFLSGQSAKPITTSASTSAKPTTPPAGKPAAAAGKPAATSAKPAAAAKPGAAKPAAKAKQVGKHSEDEVRLIVRKVANTEGLGTQRALDILDEEANVTNVSQLKPEQYDAVFEACSIALNSGEGGEPGAAEEEDASAAEEFDPTA